MKKELKKAAKLTPSWDLVSVSYKLVLNNFEPIIFLFLLPYLSYSFGSLLLGQHLSFSHLTNRQEFGLGIMGLSIIWSLTNFGPSLYFRLQVADGKQPSLGECYRRGLRYLFRLISLYLMLISLVLAGFVLFILPGIILLIIMIRRYYLVQNYIVQANLSIKEALKQCRHESVPAFKSIIGIIGVQLAFSLTAVVLVALSPIGIIPGSLINIVCLFLPALRYYEVRKTAA